MEFIQPFKVFYAQNTEISIAIIGALVIAVLIKPKQFGKILGALAIIVTIGYLIASLTDVLNTGIDRKHEASNRTDRQYHESGL